LYHCPLEHEFHVVPGLDQAEGDFGSRRSILKLVILTEIEPVILIFLSPSGRMLTGMEIVLVTPATTSSPLASHT